MRSGPDDGAVVGTGAWDAWPVVARIWQTVDVDRTVADLGLEPEAIDPDELLGARGALVRPPDEPPVVVLEPSTEGRLAEGLARYGEGRAGLYVAPPGGFAAARRAGLSALTVPGSSKFRASAVRFVVIVEAAPATIRR
jgi:hypothetical protein